MLKSISFEPASHSNLAVVCQLKATLIRSFMYESIFPCLHVDGCSVVSPSCKGCFRFKARIDNFNSSAKPDLCLLWICFRRIWSVIIFCADYLMAQRTLGQLLFLLILFEIVLLSVVLLSPDIVYSVCCHFVLYSYRHLTIVSMCFCRFPGILGKNSLNLSSAVQPEV